jgi:hypothetical protein
MTPLPLDQAVATFDAAEQACPFNQRRTSPPSDQACPKCGASRTEGCGPATAAAFAAVDSARAMLNPVGRVVQ